jgi:hypothetical protein
LVQPWHGFQCFLGDGAGAHRIAAGAVVQAQHAQFQSLGGAHLAGL